jgi:hypothetical protein
MKSCQRSDSKPRSKCAVHTPQAVLRGGLLLQWFHPTQQRSTQTTANVVYNETGSFTDSAGPHDSRVAEATVFDRTQLLPRAVTVITAAEALIEGHCSLKSDRGLPIRRLQVRGPVEVQ